MRRSIWLTVMLFSGLLAGCGGGGGGDDAFGVSPPSLKFSAELGGAAPASKTIVITPNLENTIPPDITASGSAIVTGGTTSCLGMSNANLACDWDMDNIAVVVPVPDPDTLGVGTHTGSIVIASSQHSVTVPVSYTVTAGPAEVTQITPHPVVAGVSGTATVRGSGFSHFVGITPTVKFGNTPATSVMVVNNNTLSVVYPALPAGTYDVNVSGASDTFTSTAKLVVTAPQTFASAMISTAGHKDGLIFDATRKALYVAKTDVVEKYTYDGAEWSTSPVTRTVLGVGAIALSADGGHLIAAGKNRFHDLDPDTLVQSSSTEATEPSWGTVDCAYDPCFASAAMTSNGEIIAASKNQWEYFYFYDVATGAVTSSEDFFGYPDGYLYGPTVHGSARGDRILITDHGDALVYDATQRTLAAVNDSFGNVRSLSADGTVIADGNAVLRDEGSGYTGHATLPLVPAALVLSPEGNTVYGYVSGSNVVRPYDVSVTGMASAGTDIALASNPGNTAIMTISPDGKTLFVAGDNGIVVVPVP